MHIIKLSSMIFCFAYCSLTMAQQEAYEYHNTPNVITNNMQSNYFVVKNHLHGNEIYQAVEFEQKWLLDEQSRGIAQSALNYWLGNDEHKLWLKAHLHKAESESSEIDWSIAYRRYLAEFWDVYLGIQQNRQDKHTNFAIAGLHGLAPYFFETDVVLYGNHEHIGLNLETSRDFLVTQKLIAQPFINVDMVLKDERESARTVGLAKLNAGMQTRYEITKQVIPFVEFSYRYDQQAEIDKKAWFYGTGINVKF
ncbi:MAG: copper resistance protein B [Acinetobacter sp.]|nr:MAG: copper resistance protein B [Acinetobacter sp.]